MAAVESFRIGCIGQVNAEVMRGAGRTTGEALTEMGVMAAAA